jgi:hypothetical protein
MAFTNGTYLSVIPTVKVPRYCTAISIEFLGHSIGKIV